LSFGRFGAACRHCLVAPSCEAASAQTLGAAGGDVFGGRLGIPLVSGGKHPGGVTAGPPIVTIYSLTTCGWCAKAKGYFRERGINPFVIEYDMAGPELQAKISAELSEHGARGFPFVKIGAHVVPGYAPEDYEKLLKAG
jgi:glutaredoxin